MLNTGDWVLLAMESKKSIEKKEDRKRTLILYLSISLTPIYSITDGKVDDFTVNLAESDRHFITS